MKLLKQLLEISDKDAERVYNTQMYYTDKDGENKKIKIKSALSYEKTHPAYKQAAKMLKYYDMKPPKQTPTKKANTQTSKPTPTKKAKIDFTSSAEKSKKVVKKDTPIYKHIVSHEKTIDDIRDAIAHKGGQSLSMNVVKSAIKSQSEYWQKSVKDSNFANSVVDWRDSGLAKGRMAIDAYIKKNPPPPLKLKSPVWRGMGLSKDSYTKFMKMINGKTEINLPPSSFSFDAEVATEFADQDRQIIINLKSECNELKAIALSDVPGEDSIYSDKEKEIITPSNAKYKIESVKEVEFEWSPEKISMVNLVQKCDEMNESEENVADFSNDEFMDSLFGPTQK